MQFKEYLLQPDMKKQNNVIVTKNDCYAYIIENKHIYIYLMINNHPCSYVKTPENDILYTVDLDGNKNKVSCFIWSDTKKVGKS